MNRSLSLVLGYKTAKNIDVLMFSTSVVFWIDDGCVRDEVCCALLRLVMQHIPLFLDRSIMLL